MKNNQSYFSKIPFFKFNNKWIIVIWIVIYGLVIFQDYIFSVLKNTGFYYQEAMVFNLFWLLFIPFMILSKKLFESRIFFGKNIILQIFFILVTAVAITFTHIYIFAILVKLISNQIFTPPHFFSNILKSSISSDFLITFLIYFFFPFLYFNPQLKKNSPAPNDFEKTILVHQGKNKIFIDIDSIQCFISNKPYTNLHTSTDKFLLNQSLKSIEERLRPEQFIRVHKSSIVNKNFINKIISRKNGDYDVTLQNGQSIRFSRHFQKNWKPVISPTTR